MSIIGRIVKNGNEWQYLEMDYEKFKETIEKIIAHNLWIFERCFSRCGAFLVVNGLRELTHFQMEISLKLFEATAIRSYVGLDSEMKREVNKLKKHGGNGEG